MSHRSSKPVLLFVGLMISLSIIFRSNQQAPIPEPSKQEPASLKFGAVEIPYQVEFAGESVPLSSYDVKERLDRELLVNTYWHSNTLQLFKLASRWMPLIEQVLEENCVPDDFKYAALAESGLRNVISPADAAGFWQFVESAGKESGLEINNVVDERYDIELSTQAACKYLNKAYDEFGNWTLAAASYNMGKSRLKKIMEQQKGDSYYDLYLNDETSRYVFRIIALKEIFNDPEKFGFSIKQEDLYNPIQFRTIEVENNIDDLAAFAIENGTNYKTLKLLNPWLKQTYLKVKRGKVYSIRLPIEA